MPSRFSRFLTELKRRKVYRVAAVYVAMAVGLFGAADSALPDDLWEGLKVLVGVLVLIGFPIALVLTWAYEARPEEQKGDVSPALRSADSRVSSFESLTVSPHVSAETTELSGGLACGERPPSAGKAGHLSYAVAVTDLRPEGKPAIAVLPFDDFSPNPDDAYFAGGMHEEILTQLHKIRGLAVRGRTSVMQYRENRKGLGEIARELGVGFVLEGSARKAGNQVRVTAQLVDAGMDEHLWAESYDRPLTLENLIAVQSDIAQQVAYALKAVVLADEKVRIESRPTESLQAYDLYLLGRSYWDRLNQAGFQKAIGFFEQAIDLDPEFARAYTGIADSYSMLTMGWGMPPSEAFPRVRDAAVTALRLDPGLSEAHASLGGVLLFFDRDLNGAEAALKRAIDLDPNNSNAHHWLAISFMALKRHKEALAEIRRALNLDPQSPYVNMNMGYILYVSGDLSGAVDQFNRALETFPENPLLHAFLGITKAMQGGLSAAIADIERAVELAPDDTLIPLPYLGHVYGLAGREADARRILKQLQELEEERFVNPDYFSIVHLGLGELDQAMDWLYKAREARTDWAIFFPVDPVASRLHSDSRFTELVESACLG